MAERRLFLGVEEFPVRIECLADVTILGGVMIDHRKRLADGTTVRQATFDHHRLAGVVGQFNVAHVIVGVMQAGERGAAEGLGPEYRSRRVYVGRVALCGAPGRPMDVATVNDRLKAVTVPSHRPGDGGAEEPGCVFLIGRVLFDLETLSGTEQQQVFLALRDGAARALRYGVGRGSGRVAVKQDVVAADAVGFGAEA